jgi:hypothetical protein
MTLLVGTVPSDDADVSEQVRVKTTLFPPASCWTVIVVHVNDTSVMVSVHLRLGQPGAPEIGLTGGAVVTLNDTVVVS